MKWTPDQEDLLRRLWSQGMPTATVADRLGRTRDAINKKAKALGLPARTPGFMKSAKYDALNQPKTAAKAVKKAVKAANDPKPQSVVVVDMSKPWIKEAQNPAQCGCKAVIGIEGDDPSVKNGDDLLTIIATADPKIGNWRYCGKQVTKISVNGNVLTSSYCKDHAERFYASGATERSRTKGMAPLRRA